MLSRTLAIVGTVLLGMVPMVAAQPAPVTGTNEAAKVFAPPADLRVTRDIVYARYGERELRLNLYLPPHPGQHPLPGVIVVGGSSWERSSKDAFDYVAGYLAKSGIAAATIAYRPASEARFPGAVQDVKAAVRWMRAEAAQHGINPQALGVLGCSAGGQLAALLATNHRDPTWEGAGGHEGVWSRVQAAVAMAPVTDLRNLSVFPPATVTLLEAFIGQPLPALTEVRSAASPITHVTSDSAPLLLIHSKTDAVIPYQQSTALEGRYHDVGGSAELLAFDDAPHDFWSTTRWFPDAMQRAVAFFTRTLSSPGS